MPMVGTHPKVTVFRRRKRRGTDKRVLACFMNVNVNRMEKTKKQENWVGLI